MRRRLSPPALGLALFLGLTAPLVAAPNPGDAPRAETSAEKLRRDLDRVLPSLEIVDQPLKLALAQLRELTKINFAPDYFTMAQLGIDTEGVPITLKLQNVKVRSALRTLLGQFNLSYAIVGEVVVISTDDMAMQRQLKQRVSVDYERLPLGEALKRLSRETATNLILDSRVAKEAQTPVTLNLDDVPLETAVRLMAETAALKPVRVGNVLYVTNKTSAAEIRADPELIPSQQRPGGGVDQVIIQGGPGMPAVQVPVAPPAVPPAVPPGGAEEKPAEKEKEKPAEKDKEEPAEKEKETRTDK